MKPDKLQILWEQLWQQRRDVCLPQAMLFVAVRSFDAQGFLQRLLAFLFCETSELIPCGTCRECHLLKKNVHPDLHLVQQEHAGAPLKIDQIRALQELVYQSPQRGKRCVVVIQPADRMNQAAANVLLKILEEPPEKTFFVLLAEQLGTLPATILSRCQRFILPFPQHDAYFSLQEDNLPSTSGALGGRGKEIVQALSDLVYGNTTACTLAAEWSSYPLEDLFYMIYLVFAQVLRYQLLKEKPKTSEEALWCGLMMIKPLHIAQQFSIIYDVVRKMKYGVHLNAVLLIEDFLLGAVDASRTSSIN